MICSPHLFLPDGTNHANPGVEVHYTAEYGVGFPIATADDPSIYHDLLTRAATESRRATTGGSASTP
ncbi:MAG: hypothetical protein M3Z25_22980 [Actinomycetota bacterium]|nr:hypothetical protein [Actinomycetota bacterium]